MEKPNQLERLTILVGHDEINRLKHIAVDRGVSTSKIVRSAVGDFLRTENSDHTRERLRLERETKLNSKDIAR